MSTEDLGSKEHFGFIRKTLDKPQTITLILTVYL